MTEAGLVVSGAGTAKQKFQKWWAEDEFRALLAPYFRDVRRASLDVRDSALVMVCRRPVVMRKAQLAAALRFEFELKIDGKPLGRSDRAMAAFGRYLDRRQGAA